MRSLYDTGHNSPAMEKSNECRGTLFRIHALHCRTAAGHAIGKFSGHPPHPECRERERLHMHEPATSHGVLDRFALECLGEMLRGRYHLPATLPSRVYDLVTKLPPRGPVERDPVPAAKESHYRRQAVEAMRAAQNASSENARSRLVSLAEAWVELAEKARKAGRS